MQAGSQEQAIITRRWTDELIQSNSSGQVRRADTGYDGALNAEEQRKLRQFYRDPDGNRSSSQDFEVAEIAREELQKIIDKFSEDQKLSTWQQLGFAHKPAKTKVAEVFRNSAEGDINNLKVAVDSLETEWKQKHGPVYGLFKKICNTLDDHKSILKVFPSQNNYASPLVGSVSILMKAAKSHSEISLLLSKSIAEISDKVATCSNIIEIVRTPRTRRKLAEIYARMYQFYRNAIEWYLKSKFGRIMRSFNENLVKEFEDARIDIESSIKELYRELVIASTAMQAINNGEIENLKAELSRQRHRYEARDILAGQRMEQMMQATWTEVKQLESLLERLALSPTTEQSGRVQEITATHSVSNLPQESELDLKHFIINNEGPALFERGHFWLADRDILFKLRAWMATKTESRTLWISSPYEPGVAIPCSRAAAMSTVAAAWQAEAPIISTFCKRPAYDQRRSGLSMEQVGLLSLVYSFIRQLLQFKRADGEPEIDQRDFDALNGEASSWGPGLRILRALLCYTPAVTFCVIDGLNDFELGDGRAWCKDLLNVFQERQRQTGAFLHILFSTAGQSQVLPTYVNLSDRHLSTKRAIEVRSVGRKRL